MTGKQKKIALCILSYRRTEILKKTLAKNLELIGPSVLKAYVVCNDLDDSWVCEYEKDERLEVLMPPQNLGVAGGRQAIAERALEDGMEILIFVDDDAELLTLSIGDLVKYHENYDALAFKSVDKNKKIRRHELPPGLKSAKKKSEVASFVGVGHSIKAEVFLSSSYDPRFMYGFEEFDLCFSMLSQMKKILYVPDFTVMHLADPRGRISAKDVSLSRLKNKMLIARKYFLSPFILTCWVVWSLRVLIAGGRFREIRKVSTETPVNKLSWQKRVSLARQLYLLNYPLWR